VRSKASTVDLYTPGRVTMAGAVPRPDAAYTRIVPSGFVTRSIDRAASRVPGLRRIPLMRLVSIAEIGMLARDHLARLEPEERRRLIHLVRVARGRPGSLRARERQELTDLIAKLEPRVLAGAAADRLSPIPLPQRLLRGPRKS
jgi:hypothetical protein